MANTQEPAHPAGTQVPGGASHETGTFPPFDPANFSSTLIWLALCFGLLYLLMSRIALPRMEKILDTRRARIDSDLNAAKAAKAQADAAAAAHAKTLVDARANAQATAQKAREALSADTTAKRTALEAQLAERLAGAEAQIAATKAQAMTNVASIAHDTAAAIVHHLTGLTPDTKSIAAALAAHVKA